MLGPGRKVLPEIKTEAELFCEEFQIRKGPNFSSNRSDDQKNEEIIVDGGDEEWQNGNGKIRSQFIRVFAAKSEVSTHNTFSGIIELLFLCNTWDIRG